MRELTYRDAIKEALIEEMENDRDIVLFGEDIGRGYQGCFGVTTGLLDKFGPDRIVDLPICESTIIGCAVGAAMLGLKPMAEIMFEDFTTVCFDAIVNQAAKIKTLSGDQMNLNMVIRTAGGSSGMGAQHSQCLESTFMHIPGLFLALPSDAYDAKGLLKTAIRYGDPVLFLEHQRLYHTKSPVPETDYSIPFGKGKVVRKGTDVTLVAISYMVKVAEEAAEHMEEQHGLSIEIIDPRTLVPLDTEIIGDSLKKTSKLVILEEGVLRGGVGAEIAAYMAEHYLDYLDYPIKRIASRNTIIPLAPALSSDIVPNCDRVVKEISTFLEIDP